MPPEGQSRVKKLSKLAESVPVEPELAVADAVEVAEVVRVMVAVRNQVRLHAKVEHAVASARTRARGLAGRGAVRGAADAARTLPLAPAGRALAATAVAAQAEAEAAAGELEAAPGQGLLETAHVALEQLQRLGPLDGEARVQVSRPVHPQRHVDSAEVRGIELDGYVLTLLGDGRHDPPRQGREGGLREAGDRIESRRGRGRRGGVGG